MPAHVCFAILLVLSSQAAAQGKTSHIRAQKAPGDTLYRIPEIVVTANRRTGDDEIFSGSGFVASLEMRGRKGRMDDIPSVLSSMVGVRIKQYGGLGSFATVSIRGSSSNQVEIYMDGVPLNDPFTGVADISDLPIGNVERIDLYRGFVPEELGSSAIGGAVNLVTENRKEDSSGVRFEAASSAGSFNTKRYRLSLHGKTGRLRFKLNGGFTSSAGDFVFPNDMGTPENESDDEETRRINNDFTLRSLLASAAVPITNRVIIKAAHTSIHREGGVPGIGSHQSAKARAERSRRISYVKLNAHRLLRGTTNARLNIFENDIEERFSDPDGDITSLRQETDNRVTSRGASLYTDFLPKRLPVDIKLLNEWRTERFHPVSLLPHKTEGPDRKRRLLSSSVGLDLYAFKESVIVSLNEKRLWHENEFYDPPAFPWLPPTPQGKVCQTSWSPHAGFRWHISDALTMKGNWGKYTRLPTFLELFGNLGSVTGNSGLMPESGENKDIGFVYSVGSLSFLSGIYLEAAYLDNSVENLILFFPNSQYTSKPSNIGKARIRGLELSFSASFKGSLRLSGNYTHLDAHDTGPIPYYNGNRLASTPSDEAYVGVELPGIATGFENVKAKLNYEAHFIGANYLDRANMKEVDARTIQNVSVTIGSSSSGISFTLEAKNITNNTISDVSGFPLPGRSFYATCTIKKGETK